MKTTVLLQAQPIINYLVHLNLSVIVATKTTVMHAPTLTTAKSKIFVVRITNVEIMKAPMNVNVLMDAIVQVENLEI